MTPTLREAAPTGGSPEHLLQDQSRELSRALASKPDAPMHAREAAALQAAWNEGFKHGQWQATHCAAHPPQPARVPLTDEQINQITAAQWGAGLGAPYAAYRAYARAIEAAHGIGTSAKETP